VSITFRVEGLDRVRRKLRGAGPVLRAEVGKAMAQSLLTIEGAVKERTPVDTGTLRRSIHSEIRSELHGEVGTDLRYAPYVEVGTRPHWVPGWAIAGWRRRHGMRPGAAMFVSGKAHRMFEEGLKATAGKVRRFFNQAIARATDKLNG